MNSSLDSRIMLDVSGAEVLLGNGDMLIKDGPKLVRGQGAFVSTKKLFTPRASSKMSRRWSSVIWSGLMKLPKATRPIHTTCSRGFGRPRV